MKRNSRIREGEVLAAALLMDLFFIATSQAQTDLMVFTGKFTLTDQVEWGKTVLQPGDYTVNIASGSMPILALVRDSKGRTVGRLVTATGYGKMELGSLGAGSDVGDLELEPALQLAKEDTFCPRGIRHPLRSRRS